MNPSVRRFLLIFSICAACQISAGWLLLLFLILTAAFAVLYPISLKHTLNGGSLTGKMLSA